MAKRHAVSILLTPNPNFTEVYLVERNPKLKFFGGYYAFPGGTLDHADKELEITNAQDLEASDLPYIAAAVREIFEETGLLITHGRQRIPSERRQEYRKQLLAHEVQFNEILRREKQSIDARDFHFICSILTPEFAPVRYDTQFYWVQIPQDESPEIWPGELVEEVFCTAREAIVLWEKGEMLIVPPVLFMLKELTNRSVKDFGEAIRKHVDAYRRGKIHQIYFTPGIQLIPLKTRTLLPATHTNAYLVGESELYLIDPAPTAAEEQNRLWDYLNDRLQEGRKIKAILLTHHHSDHVGAVEACQKRYDLPLFAHEKTAEKLPHLQFSRFLEHGDELDLGEAPDGTSDWKLKVYYTPGHASGHLAFQETRYAAVIAGDLVSTLSTIVIGPPDGNMATYMQSLEFLESVTSGTLYPSHGPAVRDGRVVVQYFIKHRKEREQRLLAALNDEPQSLTQLLEKVYNDVDRAMWPLAEHSLQASLSKLMGEGKCQQVGNRYQIVKG